MTFDEWADEQGLVVKTICSTSGPAGARGWARAAWQAALATSPLAGLTDAQLLELANVARNYRNEEGYLLHARSILTRGTQS